MWPPELNVGSWRVTLIAPIIKNTRNDAQCILHQRLSSSFLRGRASSRLRRERRALLAEPCIADARPAKAPMVDWSGRSTSLIEVGCGPSLIDNQRIYYI